MENPILAMIPSGYNAADAKLYSILPSDGSGDFTVSVDADATRINKEGLIEGVALNQARLTYDPLNPECPSLLLEPTVTNLVNYSQDFSFWGDNGVTVTLNDTISPDGTMNADKLQSTANNWRRNKVITLISGKNYTCSVYAKLDTTTSTTKAKLEFYRGASGVTATFDLENKTIVNSGLTDPFIKELGNGWYRIGGTFVANGTTGIFYVYPSEVYGVAGTMFYWGAQAEQSSYPTSYVPTVSTIVTRTFDICKDAGNAALFNVSKLSLFIDVNNFKRNTGSFSYIVLTDGQNSPVNMIRLDYTQNSILIRSYDNGTIKLSYDITSVVPNQRNKVLLTFDNNEAKTYFNGVLKNTSTSITIPSGLDSLSFTNRTESGGYFQGEVHDARVYDRVLTEAEAIKLTTI